MCSGVWDHERGPCRELPQRVGRDLQALKSFREQALPGDHLCQICPLESTAEVGGLQGLPVGRVIVIDGGMSTGLCLREARGGDSPLLEWADHRSDDALEVVAK